MSSTKGKTKNGVVNPLEREARAVSEKAAKQLAKDAKLSGAEFLRQFFGMDIPTEHADGAEKQAQQPTQEQNPNAQKHIEIFNFLNHQKTSSEKPKAHAEASRPREAAIDYHREIAKSRERASKGETREMRQNIEQIKVELAKLVESSQVLKLEFAEVAVEQTVNVGQYQLNFMEWMLAVIRSARQKVEDSNAWLGTVKGKGAKKGYWGMFKKHGTTFGLSGERAVATQVG